MALAYYIVTLLLSLFANMYFIFTKKRYVTSLFTGLFLLISFSMLGYISIAVSKSVEEAILATKIVYFGGQFVPAVLILIFSRFVNYKHHQVMTVVSITLAFLYFILTASIGFNGLYYKTVTLESEFGVSYLVKEYGPLHMLRYIYFLFYIATFIFFYIHAIRHMKIVSIKNVTYLVLIVVITMSFGFISNKIIPSIDFMPLGYVISETILLQLIKRMNIYNLSFAASLNLENKEYYGCVGFDLKQNYLGANKDAYQVFPELLDSKLDQPLKETMLSKVILDLIDPTTPNFKHIKVNDVYYKLTIEKNYYNNKEYGYFLEIIDDTKQVEYINLLNNYSSELEKEVSEKTAHIKEIQNKIILGMANMVETRDYLTGGHIKRTSKLVQIITKSIQKLNTYNMDDEFYMLVCNAAPMHDLGKIMISDEILNKPGKFTPEEFEVMKSHSAIGEKMVSVVLDGIEEERFITITKNIARYHHEKYSGGGYPDNLSGENIPLEARIMALADVYDALVSKRVYKERMDFKKAEEIILESMGPHFDPLLKDVFIDCKDQLEEYYKSLDE